jgi:hypothetical protein
MIPDATFFPVSASWITDGEGKPVQHLQYLPFGEPYINQHPTSYPFYIFCFKNWLAHLSCVIFTL